MTRGAHVAGALGLYLYGGGLAFALLVSYREGLPLGPRDGQAFMGPGLLGGLAMVLGLSLLAGLLLTLRRAGSP